MEHTEKTSFVFHSRMEIFRSPLGAVPVAGEVRITVRPESHRFPLRGFLSASSTATGEHLELEMEHLGAHEREGYDEYAVTLPVGRQPGLWFYHFRFENDGGSFYYGARPDHTGGEAVFYDSPELSEFQITVYAPGDPASTEASFGGGVVYQIFPDRFARGGEILRDHPRAAERLYHEDWTEDPYYRPEMFGDVVQMTNRDFFGGTFAGIQSKLDYLAGLGVDTIYLNPIFEAFSNHRYDTADYTKVDPNLGTEEDFRALCRAIHEHGMHLILDGVFNHTGSDSVYFNARGTYPEPGAYQSKDSRWFDWYEFTDWPEDYSCWWGIRTLPQTRETEPSYQRFIASDRDSVVRRWLRAGADGWRLDVADELPDDFIRLITASARKEKPDAVILGEVWEDASNKISYDVRRNYLLGGGLDGVTNYPFRTAALAYLEGGDGRDFRDALEDLLENYPRRAQLLSLNILGTHDTPRIITVLGAPCDLWDGGRERRADYALPPDRYAAARGLLKLGAFLQYTFIGMPCVYYGDEIGLEGGEDPFNRRTFQWGNSDRELVRWYRRLGELRRELEPLRTGELRFVDAEGPVICYLRECPGRPEERIYIVVSRSGRAERVRIPHGRYMDLVSGEEFEFWGDRKSLPPFSTLILRAVTMGDARL